MSFMWSIFCSICVLLDVAFSSTSYSNSLSITDDYYASISISVGTPSQTLQVLLDSTNNETFLMTNNTQSLSSKQDYFETSKSSSFNSLSSTFTYNYENATTNGTEGKDIVQVGDLNVSKLTFGLADYNQDLFESEELGGALSISRTSDFITKFKQNNDIDVYKITIDVDSKKLYFGDYSGSETNSTEVDCYTNNTNLTQYWAFKFDSFGKESTAELFTCNDKCFGVIDTASPYLTFSMSSTEYTSLFKNIGGTGNCKQSTLECDDSDDITSYIFFTIGNDSFYMSQDDFYYDDQLHLQRTDEIIDDGFVIFFGKPWLETVQIALDVSNDTMTFIYSDSGSSNANKWEIIWITAICVVAFALLFFGLYFWKFKIPPPTRRNQNEEQSLLHGQPARAQPHQPLGQPAQPPRQAPPAEPAQAVGSATGTSAASDPDEIRRRRLQFLASQEQQQAED